MLSNHLMPPPFPCAFYLSQHQGLFQWISSSHQMAKVLKLQHHPSNEYSGLISFRIYWFDLLAIYLRDSQEFSPAPQFKSFNSSVLSLLYGPTLISIHDYWKNHSFDYTFLICCLFVIDIFPRSKHLLISWLQSPWVKVAQLCPTLCDPMDYTVHGILQARILQWVAFPFSRGSSQPRDQTQVSCIACRFLPAESLYRNTINFST